MPDDFRPPSVVFTEMYDQAMARARHTFMEGLEMVLAGKDVVVRALIDLQREAMIEALGESYWAGVQAGLEVEAMCASVRMGAAARSGDPYRRLP